MEQLSVVFVANVFVKGIDAVSSKSSQQVKLMNIRSLMNPLGNIELLTLCTGAYDIILVVSSIVDKSIID